MAHAAVAVDKLTARFAAVAGIVLKAGPTAAVAIFVGVVAAAGVGEDSAAVAD